MESDSLPLDNTVLITGGAKSGKSALAEELASRDGSAVYYVATMPRIKGDEELKVKIDEHVERRPSSWITIEKETKIEEEIAKLENVTSSCIVDCLSTYVSNIMLESESDVSYEKHKKNLRLNLKVLSEVISKKDRVKFIVVTNEVGWSVVPENKSARLYRELLGTANQMMAKSASEVFLCVSGITMRIKPERKETQD